MGGTFFPALRAFDKPMAIACLGLVTFLPLRPDFSLPCFISLISVSTFLPAEGEYFRPDDFFADDFLADVPFLVLLFFAEVLLRALLFFEDELLFLVLLDLFFAAFFVAISILLENQMFVRFESVVWRAQIGTFCGAERKRLHHATNARQSHQRIGNQPARRARKDSSD